MRFADGDRRTTVGPADDAPSASEAARDDQRPSTWTSDHYLEQFRRTDPWNPENGSAAKRGTS